MRREEAGEGLHNSLRKGERLEERVSHCVKQVSCGKNYDLV